MAGDSEKRFQKIMDKLYHAPKPKPSLTSGHGISSLARGKRPELGLSGGLEKGSRVPAALSGPTLGPAPQCRPWDRWDLMRRLATFKAMTWFGKPKAISPLNCARRGWTNIEINVISCEACGARLLFSTSSSLTLQQVEKAAAVFSLKLDNGHKLLCPWIDNACDEALARFPPTPPEALVKGYKERFAALLQLTALPVISSSAIDYMKSPQLEHLLSQPCNPSITLNNGIKLINDSRVKYLEGAYEAVTDNIYYQAQKIISLCGWEPRLLPYVVDREDQSSLLSKRADSSETSTQILGQEKESIIVYSSKGPSELEEGKDCHHKLGEYQYDPACIVLDCKFCGACVGLWAFPTVEHPLELFRLVADSGQNELSTCGSDLVCGVEAPRVQNQYSNKGTGGSADDGSTTKERSFGLNFTIGGGPPPAKQNFRPRVSFPVISRHLRTEFDSIPGVGNNETSDTTLRNEINTPSFLQNDDINGGLVVCSEGLGSLKRKRSDDEDKGSDCIRNEQKTLSICHEGRNHYGHGVDLLHEDRGNIESSKEVMQNRPDDCENEALDAERKADDDVKDGENLCATSNANATIEVPEACENKSGSRLPHAYNTHDDCSSVLDSLHHSEISENNHRDSSHTASCSATMTILSNTCGIETENGGKGSDFQNLEDVRVINQKINGLENVMLSSANKEGDADPASRNNMKSLQCDKMRGFDPIRQHRLFCPWIAPEGGEIMPGWKLTLSALIHHERDFSHPSHSEAASTLIDEMEDPLVSVRKLFMSPPTKRLKGLHRSPSRSEQD